MEHRANANRLGANFKTAIRQYSHRPDSRMLASAASVCHFNSTPNVALSDVHRHGAVKENVDATVSISAARNFGDVLLVSGLTTRMICPPLLILVVADTISLPTPPTELINSGHEQEN